MSDRKRILLVEDTEDLAISLKTLLESRGYELEHAPDGGQALEMARSSNYDLIILDVMLPTIDGITVCRTLREERFDVPILMLTSMSGEMNEVVGLEAGADDYVTKPFGLAPLVARVSALLRRPSLNRKTSSESVPTDIERGELKIFTDKRKLTIAGAEVELTAREFDLLLLLALNPGRVFTASELLRLVWDSEFEKYQYAVSSVVLRLRKKIEKDSANPCYIQTVRGVGYRFAELEELS